jgi:hypothetical protein
MLGTLRIALGATLATLLAAWLVCVIKIILYQLRNIDPTHIDWSTIFTATFVISYLLAAIPIWHKAVPQIFKLLPRVAATLRWQSYHVQMMLTTTLDGTATKMSSFMSSQGQWCISTARW